MTGIRHQYFGVMYAASIALLFDMPFVTRPIENYDAAIMFVVASIIGSVFPDIDHPSSLIGRLLFPVSVLINKLFGHRTITHSLLGFILIGSGAYAAVGSISPLWLGFVLGYISHLLADMMTIQGCPLLWPNKRRFALPFRIKTGSSHEAIALFICSICFALLLYWRI